MNKNFYDYSFNWKLTLIYLVISIPFLAIGQQQLAQNFKFENGVYVSFEAFQQNQPTYKGGMIEGNFFINQNTKQAKIEYIRLKESKENLDLEQMWAVVIKGIPYIKVTPNLPKHSLKVFAAMEVRGNICYYAYDDIENKAIPFKVYNPVIGKPFRTTILKRDIPLIREKMLKFETGEVVDFNYQNLLDWLAKDTDITKALKSLGAKQAEEKLFDALLLYNEKYAVNLK